MCKNEVEADRPRMTIWRMRIACSITKAIDKTQDMKYLLFFHGKSGCAKAPKCYVIRALPVLSF